MYEKYYSSPPASINLRISSFLSRLRIQAFDRLIMAGPGSGKAPCFYVGPVYPNWEKFAKTAFGSAYLLGSALMTVSMKPSACLRISAGETTRVSERSY